MCQATVIVKENLLLSDLQKVLDMVSISLVFVKGLYAFMILEVTVLDFLQRGVLVSFISTLFEIVVNLKQISPLYFNFI